jgi:hypothetical protein
MTLPIAVASLPHSSLLVLMALMAGVLPRTLLYCLERNAAALAPLLQKGQLLLLLLLPLLMHSLSHLALQV